MLGNWKRPLNDGLLVLKPNESYEIVEMRLRFYILYIVDFTISSVYSIPMVCVLNLFRWRFLFAMGYVNQLPRSCFATA